MMELVLGITDKAPPSSWAKTKPQWEDEHITANTSHSFLDLMTKLCDTAIKTRREVDGDHGIDQHCWNMEISSLEMMMKRANPDYSSDFDDDDDFDDDFDDDDDDDDNSEIGRNSHRPILVPCPMEEEYASRNEFGDYSKVIKSKKKLSSALGTGQEEVIKVEYDNGNTTTLYLKVIRSKPTGVQSLIEYFTTESDLEAQIKDIQSTPAYNLRKEDQLDAHFPFLSNVVLGKYVPIIIPKDGQEDPHGYSNRNITGCVSMGKVSCITTEKETHCFTIEGRSMNVDMMYCPHQMEPNELLSLSEEAWTPRHEDKDTDQLKNFRYESICRYLIPKDDDELYESMEKCIKNDNGFGPKMLLFRAAKDGKKSAFDFQKVFPITYGMFTNNKFRWFQYKKDILRIIVGRGSGPNFRNYQSNQVLKIWKHKFESFHEILCAVEASWVYKGEQINADTFLSDFDADLSPSNPAPKEPLCLGKAKDCVTVVSKSDIAKMVTTMAITVEEGKSILYSGHDDGTLSKWNLDDNTEIWTKQLYKDNREDNRALNSYDSEFHHVQETMGVAGLVIRPHKPKSSYKGKISTHLIYTWTDCYEGIPDVEFEDRDPATIKCWKSDGTFLRSYACDVGKDDEDKNAHPSIGPVVFCPLYEEERGIWFDSIVVGLHCRCESYNWEGDYSQFDLEYSQEGGQGNIIPFYEHSEGSPMETWRESLGLIRALAVVPKKYVFSYSVCEGTGDPDAMVLWSCKEPGVPLYRHDLRDYQASPYNQNLTRLAEVVGISIAGTDIVIADKYGDRIATVYVEDDDGEPCIELKGYAFMGNGENDDGWHGRMAMSERHAIMANEIDPTVWIFKIQECYSHEKLDKREGNESEFIQEDECHEDNPRRYHGREIAVGKVIFPEFGGNKPNRKKRKSTFAFLGEEEDTKDGLGRGGPIVLATKGKFLIAGYTNGTITRAPHLPSDFESNDMTIGANELASCSYLPSDEWHTPYLEQLDDPDGPVTGSGPDNECTIQ